MSELVKTVRRRLSERTPQKGPPGLRPAAVLLPILLGPDPTSERLLLTRRSQSLRRQPGDISFPGGAVDPTDPSPLATALRESHEEVGLAAQDAEVIGQLDERGTVTGFCITPFVAVVRTPYTFQVNHEVDLLIEVPVSSLRVPEVLEVEQRRLPSGELRDVFHYHFEEHDIWGITGRLIRDFLELV